MRVGSSKMPFEGRFKDGLILFKAFCSKTTRGPLLPICKGKFSFTDTAGGGVGETGAGVLVVFVFGFVDPVVDPVEPGTGTVVISVAFGFLKNKYHTAAATITSKTTPMIIFLRVILNLILRSV